MGVVTNKKIAYLQLHRICDQECIFCAQPSNGTVLDFPVIQKQLDMYKGQGYSKVIFSGGEPSLNKDFFQVIQYGASLELEMTILSNGHRFAEMEFAKESIRSGLLDYHISLHSHIPRIHDALVKKPGSLKRCFTALQNLLALSAHVTINITINSRNVEYFDTMVKTILQYFPTISGFIINNLETSQIPQQHTSVIASLDQIKKTIPKTLELIVAAGKYVRIERVPMCYIRGYEHLSTDMEYRIQREVKYLHYIGESRESMELSEENYVREGKYGPNCHKCSLYDICAGMEAIGAHYPQDALIPQLVSQDEKEKILQRFQDVFQTI